jgi:PTH1 family peptidyl-tRNA hydrolase
MVVDKAIPRMASRGTKVRFESDLTEADLEAERVLLAKPLTYMNLSGRSVRQVLEFYKLSPSDLLVACDDLNLDSGRLRIRASGSAGGQKGLVDIIAQLGTNQFARLRVGIGRPPVACDAADYVLGKLTGDEAITIDLATTRASQAVVDWIRFGTAHVMNHYNAPT